MDSSSSLPTGQPDTLVAHLLAAKRSLSCVDHVYRADDLVKKTRQALEDHTITAARTIFLHNGSTAQANLLDHVLDHTRSIARDGGSEFQKVIGALDAAQAKLQQTLDQLRATKVESSLRPDAEPSKTLVDFVDESGVTGLLSSIKESIDASAEARRVYGESNAALEDDISQVRQLLTIDDDRERLMDLHNNLHSPVLDILQSMEEHAQEMADNLESLVKHFDICVTAIKHTEGGGAAAQQITDDLPEGVAKDLASTEMPLEPMSEEERAEMLEVLEKDANEVEDVVMDIRDRSVEMERNYERVELYTEQLAQWHDRKTTAISWMEAICERLPNYITQSHVFLLRWDEEKTKIADHMEELEGLREFYDGFLSAYDNLIIEIGRRKTTETRMKKLVQDSMARMDRLFEEDLAERDAFRQEQGDFLPVDIWPGLMMPPQRYKICLEDQGVKSVPDISASVIQRSIRRVTGRPPAC
ncbi:autophagy protein 17 [Xylographa carneopallida]|nr:autophagy protein 17 [Xylographa carneopallida]